MQPNFTITSRGGHPDFLDLPWGTALSDWEHPRLVKMAHGISRHVVRFVRYADRVYALKETEQAVAWSEYRMLRELKGDHLPVVEAVGVVSGDLPDDGAMLITRYLDFSLPYWYLLGRDEPALADHLISAAVVLLVRLHLDGVFWGDCSLSNILFRRDAGAMMAYLVDAETTERHATISDAQRRYDLEIARENVFGGLLDLQAQGRVPAEVDPVLIADDLQSRYDELWDELTRVEEFPLDERWRIDQRLRHINDLGFDVEEMTISSDGHELRVRPVLLEEGHHARELLRRTGLAVQENQARRLLGDIANYRAWLARETGRDVPAAVAAARWLSEIYDPIIQAVPAGLRERLEPAEIFHNLLVHRYFLSERAGAKVSNEDALNDYLSSVLERLPTERQLDETDMGPELH
ncbi:MAG: DUF4032 domain-containing protein [Acidimicrobiia bacterium]|nr:DUF4032 domain-containing protein [Acidimicrobiia bacterium]